MLEFYLMTASLLSGLFFFFFLLCLLFGGLEGGMDDRDRENAKAMGAVTLLAWVWPLAIPVGLWFIGAGAVSLVRGK